MKVKTGGRAGGEAGEGISEAIEKASKRKETLTVCQVLLRGQGC